MASSSNTHLDEKSSSEQNRKVFLGGLIYTTTDADLIDYCSKYGEITECNIIRDREGRSRGFAFISFKDSSMVDYFIEQQQQQQPHIIDGKKIEVKRALSRDQTTKSEEQLMVKKIFIGGIKEDITEDDLKSYFQKFGTVICCNIVKDQEEKIRGFGFLSFDDYNSVDRCIIEKPHFIKDIELDIRKAIPRMQRSHINSEFYNQSYLMFNPSIPTHNINPEQYYQSYLMPMFSPTPYVYFPPPNNSLPKSNSFLPSTLPKKVSQTHFNKDEQHRKLFIGGLSYKTTDETLKDYMSQYGEITDCLVMKDDHGKSKCFGFVTFINSIIIDEFMKHRPHIIDGRQVDPKRAMPREEANDDDVHLNVKKIFIGGIRNKIDEDLLKNYFSKYGNITDCLLMNDNYGNTRGFAFIEFDDYDSVDKIILARPHIINEHRLDVKKAIPKDQRLFSNKKPQIQQRTNYFPYPIFNNPITSFSPWITNPNVGGGAFIDNNISNSLYYIPARNTNNSH